MTEVINNYVINPETYWCPAYRISPFNTSYLSINSKICQTGKKKTSSLESLFGKEYTFCKSGKDAIRKALKHYDLQKDDEVWVITTSGNTYISSCVTGEIEKFCAWNASKTDATKVIFVNHEFGFCYKKLEELKQYNLPVIEDKALSFFSQDEKNTCGNIGDFVIYSLPKFFPMNYGGILQSNTKKLQEDKIQGLSYLETLVHHYLNNAEAISAKRIFNYNYLIQKFAALSFKPYFNRTEKEIPGVFMFLAPGVNLPELKRFMQANGVESSIFYGKEAFFIPVHHNLNTGDLDFFFELVKYFIDHGVK